MAVAGVKISLGIECAAERIDLPPSVFLNPLAIESDAVGVAGIHIHLMPIPPTHMAVVVVAMRAIQPTVEPPSEARLVAMGVAGIIKRPIQDLPLVRLPITVCIVEKPD